MKKKKIGKIKTRLRSKEKKQIDTIKNQNKLEVLTNKDDHKSGYKKIIMIIKVVIKKYLKN